MAASLSRKLSAEFSCHWARPLLELTAVAGSNGITSQDYLCASHTLTHLLTFTSLLDTNHGGTYGEQLQDDSRPSGRSPTRSGRRSSYSVSDLPTKSFRKYVQRAWNTFDVITGWQGDLPDFGCSLVSRRRVPLMRFLPRSLRRALLPSRICAS